MNACISTSGHVCLCEWSGPVTVTMVVSLLSHLQHPTVLNGPSAADVPIAVPHQGASPVPCVTRDRSHHATCTTQSEIPPKQADNDAAATVLIINLHPSAARCILSRTSTFADVLPALWAYCQEIIIACPGEQGLINHLRRTLCGSASTPIATLARPLVFFELLDEAFDHAQGVYPQEVLELRRRRIRSGMWATDAEDDAARNQL